MYVYVCVYMYVHDYSMTHHIQKHHVARLSPHCVCIYVCMYVTMYV